MTEKEAIQMLERILDPDPWEDDGLSDKAKEALQMAVDALEKQIPKETILRPAGLLGNIVTYSKHCPECDHEIFAEKYCSHCGQKIYWWED